MSNGTTTAYLGNPDHLPAYVPIVIGIGAAMLLAILTFFSCRCLSRQRRKAQQLMELTPKSSSTRMIGIRSSDNIQFVVPTPVQVSETTDESFSETDSSGKLSDREGRVRRKTAVGFQISPEKLEKTLYNGSLTDNVGRVGFSLHYNHHRQQICVRLVAAMDLPSYFLKGTANPYAKLVLLPEKSPKYFTRIHRNTLNPVFNESFIFPIKKAEFDQRVLKITIWDYDRYSRKVLIGEVLYPVKDAGINGDSDCDVTSADIWVNLTMDLSVQNLPSCGELLFSLCYSPEKSTLTLTVLKTRRLHIDEKEKDTAVYVKATLYVRRKLVRTKKTPSKRKTPDVEFNHGFQIHVPQSALADVDILVTLCSKSGIGSKHIIGRTQVGGNCSSEQGIQHWQDMLSSLDSTSAQWHQLTRDGPPFYMSTLCIFTSLEFRKRTENPREVLYLQQTVHQFRICVSCKSTYS